MNTARHPVAADTLAGLYTDIGAFRAVEVDNAVRRGRVLRNLLFSSRPEHVDRFRSAAYAAALAAMLEEARPSVVQLESPFLGSYMSLIRERAAGAKIVYRMHNVEGQVWARLAGQASGWKRTYLRSLAARISRYERQLWERVDLLLPITRTDAGMVKAAGIRTPMEVAPFGIAAGDQPEPAWPALPLRLYHLGAMDWLPNREAMHWFLWEVWPRLHEAFPELSFHFAGRNMPASFKSGLPEGAFCAGEVADAAAFVQDKHLLVVPLRSGGGIRVKILEAMSAGRIVLSTATGMQGIEAEDQVHYLEADTADGFISRVAWVSNHPERARSLAASGRELVAAHYDQKRIMSRIIRTIDSLIGG